MAPKKSIQYILYGTLCIVSLVIALLVFWWITGKPYTVEDFSTQMPYMALVGVTGPVPTFIMRGNWIYGGSARILIQRKFVLAGGNIAYAIQQETDTKIVVTDPNNVTLTARYYTGPISELNTRVADMTKVNALQDVGSNYILEVASAADMAGTATGTGQIYYADIDVPMNPKWISSGITGVGELAGSYGKLYTVAPGGSVPKYGAYDSATQTAMNGGTVTQISVDDNEAIGGTNGTSYLYSAAGTSTAGTSTLTSVTANAKQVSLAGRMGYYIGEDGKLYFSGNPSTTARIMIDPGTSWKQVSFDGTVVCAIKTDGTLWCADKNISVPVGSTGSYGTQYTTTVNTGANFTSTSTPVGLSYISLKAGRLVAIGNDSKLYYTNSYKAPSLSWVTVPTQPYDVATGLATGSPVTFSKIIMMYPRHDARRKRFLGSASSCNSNEQQIGSFCYLPCVSGRNPRGTSCPYKARHIDATASCPRGYDFINNGCYGECPPGYTANNQMCRGPSTPAATRPQASVTPQRYSCPSDGSVSGRYVRVRPTTLIANNKLCISKIVVKDSAGRILSCASSGTGSGSGTCSGTGSGSGSSSIRAYATDGTCIDTPIGGTSCGIYSSYISGATYDRDTDGGKMNRAANLYWDLDLGSIRPIKTIEFTGCSYQGANAGSSVAAGTPNADQITGMRIEVLYNSNSPMTAPNASRTLGLAKTQTITFNYVNVDADEPTRCYDNCPSINGVSSIDQGDSTCVSASGGITQRSITAPRKVSDPICGPAKLPDGTIYAPPFTINGAAVSLRNWVPDPANSNYVLSCDVLPTSVLVPITNTINVPRPTAHPNTYQPHGHNLYYDIFSINDPKVSEFYTINNINTSLDTFNQFFINKATNAAYTNTETPYVCVIPSVLECEPDTSIVPGQNICKINEDIQKVFTLTPAYNDINASNTPYSCQQIYFNRSGVTNLSDNCYHGADTRCHLPSAAFPIGSKCTPPKVSSSVAVVFRAMGYSYFNYSNPKVTDGVNIARPARQQAQCKCQDTSAFLYKGQCMKCSSSKDVFYPKGVTTLNTWGQRTLNTFLATSGTNTQGSIDSLQSTQFLSIEAAKTSCEIDPRCTGVTQFFDVNGQAFYTLGLGQPVSTTTASSSRTSSSTWLVSRGAVSKAITGDYTGKEFSSKDIPRAFADDYVSPDVLTRAAGSSISQVMTMYDGVKDMINYFKTMVGQATASATVIANLERPETYYVLQGTDRRLQDNTPTSIKDTGICVGPCDSINSVQDPIQMIYDTNNKRYILQGTTCNDGTKIVIDKPSIPAINTPQIGNTCPPYVHTNSTANPIEYTEKGSQCIEQCPAGSELDQNGNCVMPDIPRTSIVPNYACPTGFTELDMICIYPNPCESGHTLNGEYCEPPVSIVPTTGGSTTINCTRTSYGYSSNRGGSATAVNKWLCDSSEDLNALIAGPAASSSTYIGPNDIVCVADDPTTGMYYCQSIADAKNKVDNGMRENVTKVCTNLTKAYYDLSNNLNILSSARTSAQNTTTQMAAIQRTLLGVYTSICASTAGSSPLCNQMASQLDSLSQNVNSGSSRVSGVLNPIQVAMASRDTLVAQMTKFQCSY